MKFLILLLLSPAVICAQRYRKSTNPNDEPFLPIHPEYPYSPKLMKRGLEQQQQAPQVQALAQLTPELYAPKVDARDSYSASYSQTPYYPTYDTYGKATTTPNALTTTPYYQTAYPNPYSSNAYGLINSYGTPYASATPNYTPTSPSYGASSQYPLSGASSPYPVSGPSSPYPSNGAYPYYYYQPPYYYPNYYNQPPYPPPPPGYPSGSSKHHNNNDDDDDEEDDHRREKSKKTSSTKSKTKNSDRDNQYVDGNNYIISSAKDLDGESSSHRTPSHYNQIEDSDVQPRTATLPKTTYRLVSISGQQQPSNDYNSGPNGYIKIQQLEQLMRQALARLLAQNAAQQANLAQIQQEAANQQQNTKDNQQSFVVVPTGIAKTGLSYVVNPTILSRVTPGQYNPSQLLQTLGNGKQSYGQKPTTSVTLQQSPGIYIPPGSKAANDQSSASDYSDYDSPESATAKNQQSAGGYHATAEPSHNYPYSTYRPTQQTSLDDVNFGSKQKTKS